MFDEDAQTTVQLAIHALYRIRRLAIRAVDELPAEDATGALLHAPVPDEEVAAEDKHAGSCQAQVLRFFADDEPGRLIMRRYVIVKGIGSGYAAVEQGNQPYEELVFEFKGALPAPVRPFAC